MTQPEDSPQVFDGTDISVDPDELEVEAHEKPATTDAEQMAGGDDGMGGTGGEAAGGAG